MSDTTHRDALERDVMRRLTLCDERELRELDGVLLRMERAREDLAIPFAPGPRIRTFLDDAPDIPDELDRIVVDEPEAIDVDALDDQHEDLLETGGDS